jgi:hypothetical protein
LGDASGEEPEDRGREASLERWLDYKRGKRQGHGVQFAACWDRSRDEQWR